MASRKLPFDKGLSLGPGYSAVPEGTLVIGMRVCKVFLSWCFIVGAVPSAAADMLLQHVQVYDGTGRAPFAADVRVRGERIVAVATHLRPVGSESVVDEHGLALAPGLIDRHSHGDSGLREDLDART